MSICKDCIHYEICSPYVAPDESFPEVDGCKCFKAKSDMVEVVRCKGCKHLEIINDGKVYAKCRMTDFEFQPFGTDTRVHYCGYGERSEK